MNDLVLTGLWSGVLAAGIVLAMALRAAGLASTYVRDLLHVGAGSWAVGWWWWSAPHAPIAIAVSAAVVLALIPRTASRSRLAERFHRAVASGDERFTGLIIYAAAFAVFTALGVLWHPFPAAAGLLALALGDGIGGAIGRRWGRHHFALPFGKRKSFEGSIAVAIWAAVGVAIAGAVYGVAIGPIHIATLGIVAAAAEAAAPRSTDNLLVPAAVWAAALALTG